MKVKNCDIIKEILQLEPNYPQNVLWSLSKKQLEYLLDIKRRQNNRESYRSMCKKAEKAVKILPSEEYVIKLTKKEYLELLQVLNTRGQ